jgi:hypothetical protein
MLQQVLYLCFGSKSNVSDAQVKEIAAGLEKAGHRFLLCLLGKSSDVLPLNFMENTKDRGMVWFNWAPQAQILAHPTVGGFLTHCGWSSILESIWFGVPMIALPLFGDQLLNAVEIVRDAGVAVHVTGRNSGGRLLAAEDFEKAIRCTMGDSEEGKRVRAKVKDMQSITRKAVEEGGSSFKSLSLLVEALAASNAPVYY